MENYTPKQNIGYRLMIHEHGLRIGNDTPIWFKPRRTIWFILKDGKTVKNRAGRPRYFKSAIGAARAMERLAKEIRTRAEADRIAQEYAHQYATIAACERRRP